MPTKVKTLRPHRPILQPGEAVRSKKFTSKLFPTPASTVLLRDAIRLAEFIQRELPEDDQIEIVRLALKAIYPRLALS